VEAIVIVTRENDVIAEDLAAGVGWKALLRNAGGSEAWAEYFGDWVFEMRRVLTCHTRSFHSRHSNLKVDWR
jgi:hypothetical protein